MHGPNRHEGKDQTLVSSDMAGGENRESTTLNTKKYLGCGVSHLKSETTSCPIQLGDP